MNSASLEFLRDMAGRCLVPIPEQTERFVRYIIEDHSWYKHLPVLPPGARFYFWISPTAGLYDPEDGSGYIEITDENRPWGDIPITRDYRERFGHWMYTRSLKSDELEGWTVPVSTGSDRASVPVEVLENCSCTTTAFLHPRASAHRNLIIRRANIEMQTSKHDVEHSDFERYLPLLEIVKRDLAIDGYGFRGAQSGRRGEAEVAFFAYREHRLLENRIRSTLIKTLELLASLALPKV